MAAHFSSLSRGVGSLVAIENLYRQPMMCEISVRQSSNGVGVGASSESSDHASPSDA